MIYGLASVVAAQHIGRSLGLSTSQECTRGSLFVGSGRLLEAESFHITNQHVDNPAVALPPASRSFGSHAPARERPTTPVRLGLQRRAQSNFQRHFLRGLRRFVILLTGDLASFYLMRALVRAVRDSAVVGGTVSATVDRWLPAGILNGWQYAAALFVGLLVLDRKSVV